MKMPFLDIKSYGRQFDQQEEQMDVDDKHIQQDVRGQEQQLQSQVAAGYSIKIKVLGTVKLSRCPGNGIVREALNDFQDVRCFILRKFSEVFESPSPRWP